MGKRNLYLNTKPVEEAQQEYLQVIKDLVKPAYERVDVIDSLDRITKEATYAKFSSPLYNCSAMDGIAVISERTNDATETAPTILTEEEDYLVVDTGDPVHPPYDAVIMAEDIVEMETVDGEPGKIKVMASVPTWQHIRSVGEDIVAGEMILPGKHRIRPIDIGVLLSAGITKIDVVRRPRVAIFPTGDEIVEADSIDDIDLAIQRGNIIESNSRMFENMVTKAGGIGERYGVLPDDYDLIKNAITDAIKEHDLVIVNAGSSAGRDDHTVHILRELGEVIVHGVAIKPGKPVILAIVDGKPVIGLPGYPVSAYIGFENFVAPVLAMMMQAHRPDGQRVDAIISRRLISSLKHKEYVRVKVGKVGNQMIAAPLERGAGAAMSLVRADGFCIIPRQSEGMEAGEKVSVELYRDLAEVEHTVVVIGSHDLILDVMADMMPNLHSNMFISSTHVGSMAGLMALKRGEAHVAPTHLLDEDTGEYNVPILKRLFSAEDDKMGGVTLIKGVGRTQGLMVKKGNPLGIKDISDIARPLETGTSPRFVNRQRGAGTRVLLDHKLKILGIDASDIVGYDREAATHMAVAAAVASDGADVGMGVFSAARAMDLDFIPIADEEYDFAVPTEYLELPHIKAFIEILKSDMFKERVEALGGYTFRDIGSMITIGEKQS